MALAAVHARFRTRNITTVAITAVFKDATHLANVLTVSHSKSRLNKFKKIQAVLRQPQMTTAFRSHAHVACRAHPAGTVRFQKGDEINVVKCEVSSMLLFVNDLGPHMDI